MCFVDSDDTLSFCYLEAGLTKIQTSKADICLNDWAFQTEETKYVCTNDSTIKFDFTLVGNVAFDSFFMQAGKEHSYYVLWNKIFRKEILLFAKESIENLEIHLEGIEKELKQTIVDCTATENDLMKIEESLIVSSNIDTLFESIHEATIGALKFVIGVVEKSKIKNGKIL